MITTRVMFLIIHMHDSCCLKGLKKHNEDDRAYYMMVILNADDDDFREKL